MRFIHVRNQNEVGELSAKGGITIGFEIEEPGILCWTMAKCSPKDHYNKSIGRAICEGRFDIGQFGSLTYSSNDNPVSALLDHLKLDSREI